MFFRIFNQPKNKSAGKVISLILLVCFIITLNGCVTTNTVKYQKEKLTQDKSSKKIEYIVLSNGLKINTAKKEVLYVDSIKSLVIMNYDTAKNINIKSEIIKSGNLTIPLNNVLEVFVNKTETSTGLTTLFIAGVIAGVALTTILIKNATVPDTPPAPPLPPEEPPPPPPGSCPLVYSFDGEKYVFDSEPLSGVISEGMTRTDYSGMEFLEQSERKFRLHVKNQPGEKEMLDEVKLVNVPHQENAYVTPNPEGEFFSYKEIFKPESVTDENGKDVSVFFNEKDNIRWQTQMAYDTSFKGGSDRHKLKFKFPKPERAANALLLVNCGTAYWGAHMIKTMLQLKGDKVDEWYGNLFSGDKNMQKLYQCIFREELFMLKINLLEGNKYNARTFIPSGGPLIDEDKIIRLPLENVTGDYVEFELNPPQGFWKIDQIGIIYDYEIIGKDKTKELDAVYAADQDGKDIRNEIKSIDKNYYEMPVDGNYSNIYFDAPADFDKKRNEIFLKTTGYYEIFIDKSKSEQTELIEELMNTKGKITEYSMMLYRKYVKQISGIIKYDGNK